MVSQQDYEIIEAVKAGDSVTEKDEQQLTPLKLWEYTLGPDGEIPKLRAEVSEVGNKSEIICNKIDGLKQSINDQVIADLTKHEERISEIEKTCAERRLAGDVKNETLSEAEARGRSDQKEDQAEIDRQFVKRVKVWSLIIGAAGLFLGGLTLLLTFFF